MATYTVQKGDTLSGIAQKTLGNAGRWGELGYTGDPTKLPIGTVLNIPGSSTSSQAPSQNTGTVSAPNSAPTTSYDDTSLTDTISRIKGIVASSYAPQADVLNQELTAIPEKYAVQKQGFEGQLPIIQQRYQDYLDKLAAAKNASETSIDTNTTNVTGKQRASEGARGLYAASGVSPEEQYIAGEAVKAKAQVGQTYLEGTKDISLQEQADLEKIRQSIAELMPAQTEEELKVKSALAQMSTAQLKDTVDLADKISSSARQTETLNISKAKLPYEIASLQASTAKSLATADPTTAYLAKPMTSIDLEKANSSLPDGAKKFTYGATYGDAAARGISPERLPTAAEVDLKESYSSVVDQVTTLKSQYNKLNAVEKAATGLPAGLGKNVSANTASYITSRELVTQMMAKLIEKNRLSDSDRTFYLKQLPTGFTPYPDAAFDAVINAINAKQSAAVKGAKNDSINTAATNYDLLNGLDLGGIGQ